MPQWYKNGDTQYPKHTKINGSSTPNNNNNLLNRWIYCTVNGVATWRPIYSYRWALSDWGACSVTCGGGTKTKTYECIREDGYTGSTKHKDGTYTGTLVSNNYCTKSGLTTPSGSTISTSCNNHSCTVTVNYYLKSDDQWVLVQINKSDNGYSNKARVGTNGGAKSGSFTAHYNDFPLRLIFVGHNWDNGGGPKAGSWVNVNGGSNIPIQPCSDHTGGHWDLNVAVSFELNYNNTIKKLNGAGGSSTVTNCLQSNGYTINNKDPWYNKYTLTSFS